MQKRAAIFVTGISNYATWSMTGIHGQIKWESPDNKIITKRCSLFTLTQGGRNHHLSPSAGADIYKGSFSPQIIKDWNALREYVIPSAEVADDCVVKFISLVRARG